MTTKRPQLAKLTRPRLHNAVARERLFELLDEKRKHPAIWVAGPPGAGKTTLVASFEAVADRTGQLLCSVACIERHKSVIELDEAASKICRVGVRRPS